MKIVFDKNDMIEFVKWYDGQNEENLKRTFEEDFNAWLALQNTTSNKKYTAPQATPKSCPDFEQGKACKHGLRQSCGVSCSCVPEEA